MVQKKKSMLAIDEEKINKIIQSKTAAAIPAFIAEQAKYGMAHSANGINKIKAITRKREGMINKIKFQFRVSGIYREKGAGKGFGGAKGSKWINAKGETKTTNPNSLNKQGTGSRSAADWFNPVAEKLADELAEELLTEFVEIAFNQIKIK
jgi:hypothetical protein